MQLVSDLQQRPKKGRLSIEKNVIPFYDFCTLVQLGSLIAQIVLTMIGCTSTFKNYIIVPNDFALVDAIAYKTRNCQYNTTRSIFAFTDVEMRLDASNINDVFVDLAVQLRLSMFVGAVTLFVAIVNRSLVEANVFVIRFRSFLLWKDIISATELLLLGYVLQIAVAARSPGALLKDYLTHCGVFSRIYLPFVGVNSLFVFVAMGYFSYVVGLLLYLNNALPKYGVMTPAEIGEYKAWLRARRAEMEQARLLVEEAKLAHARLELMRGAQLPQNKDELGGLPPLGLPPNMAMPPYATQPYLQPQGSYPSPPYPQAPADARFGWPPYNMLPPQQQQPFASGPPYFQQQQQPPYPPPRGPAMPSASSLNMPRRRQAPPPSAARRQQEPAPLLPEYTGPAPVAQQTPLRNSNDDEVVRSPMVMPPSNDY